MIPGKTREKKGKTPFFAYQLPPCRFSFQAPPFFGKTGTGDIVSYFHKKIKPPEKCKPLENNLFAIFAIQKRFSTQSTIACFTPWGKTNGAPICILCAAIKSYAGFVNKKIRVIHLQNWQKERETLGPPRPQFRRLNHRKSASCGHCSFRLISPPMKFPPQAVIGGSSPRHGPSAPGPHSTKKPG